jgi:pimeloyl-ACP methyl ester carboxylesterase
MTPPSPLRSRRQFLASAVVAGAAAAVPTDRPPQQQSDRSPIVLVHGAWHGGWCWRRVADRLSAKGRYVVAPTLSGVGERSHLASDAITLSTHVDDVVNEVKWKDLDHIVLVGHSYGGIVITAAAERIRERIAAIVYLDAFIPLDGQSMSMLRNNSAAPLAGAMTPAPPAAALKVNAKDIDWVNSKLTAHPTRCFTEPVRVSDAYQTIQKKLYIRAPAFAQPAFDAAYQRCRADRQWKTIEMACGHDIMIDEPAELAAILDAIV